MLNLLCGRKYTTYNIALALRVTTRTQPILLNCHNLSMAKYGPIYILWNVKSKFCEF